MRQEFWPQKWLWVVANDNEGKAFSYNAVQYHQYMIQNDTCSVFSTKLAILRHIINHKLLKYAPYINSMECTLIVLDKIQHATMRFNWTMPAKFQNWCLSFVKDVMLWWQMMIWWWRPYLWVSYDNMLVSWPQHVSVMTGSIKDCNCYTD